MRHPDLGDEPHAARPTTDPVDPADEAARPFDEDRGLPSWSWSAAAPLAAALGRSTQAGDALIRDALTLRHRLPRLWRRVERADLEAWRARRIAQLVAGAPDDVCALLDDTLADIAHRVGPATLARLLDEAMLRLHAEERELAQIEALDRRHATLDESSINVTGVADLTIRGDWKDLHDFDQALSVMAGLIAQRDAAEGRYADCLDVRRSRAVGVLADPAAALALIEGRAAPAPSKHAVLVLHLGEDAVTAGNPVGRCETSPALVQQLRDWLGRTDTHVTVQPVVDLADHVHADAYEVRGRLRAHTDLLHHHCVFPWCGSSLACLRPRPHRPVRRGRCELRRQRRAAVSSSPPPPHPRRLALHPPRRDDLPLVGPPRPAVPHRHHRHPRRHPARPPRRPRFRPHPRRPLTVAHVPACGPWICWILLCMEMSIGPVTEREWPAARGLLHRAFVNEPFTVEIHGPAILDRWGGSWSLYSSLRSDDASVVLGAHVSEVLVGVVMGSRPGRCRLCQVLAREPRPDDHLLAIDWQFHQNVARVHGQLDEHAWIEKAAVEPALHGVGIGRRLLEAVATALEIEQPADLVLECAPDRVNFYAGLGYEVLSTFADPAGPDAYSMRRRIP